MNVGSFLRQLLFCIMGRSFPFLILIFTGELFMEYILNASEMKECDRYAIEEIGIPSLVLMERAALAVVDEILNRYPNPGKILVICGSGNNGADGFAAARLLRERGCEADLLFAGHEASLSEECRTQREICQRLRIPEFSCSDRPEPDLDRYDLILDALFGIGLSREISGFCKDLIRSVNQCRAVKAAVDIPSGVCADNGAVLGCAVHADLTVTFAARKIGHLLYPGTEYCGQVICRQIGIPVPNDRKTTAPDFRDLAHLPVRPGYSNKGSFGKVLLIAGTEGMSGAACLAGLAAYRTGCGLVRIYTPECNRIPVQTLLPEAVVTVYHQEEDAVTGLEALCRWADTVAVGPGIGTGQISEQILERLLEVWDGPLVLDADALNLLSARRDLLAGLKSRRIPAILTPHIGEMMRLTGSTKEQLLSGLIESCTGFARKYSLICVQKDARTIVSDGARVCINESGNNGMAAGGSGDVLTGLLASLLAQGMPPFAAASVGVYLHGLAGDRAAAKLGRHGMIARDLADSIADVLCEVQSA